MAASYGYDASGNIATDSTDTTVYTLTDDQRLESVTKNGLAAGDYQYDGRGLRTVKTVNGETTLFIYCKSGKLLAEADNDGNVLKEYVYLEGDIFAHFQYEVPAPAPPEAASSAEPSQAAAPEPMLVDNPPAVAEASTPSDTSFLPAIYMLLLLNKKSAEGAYYYINDHLGAPQVITDDTGSVVWRAEYLPFGNVNIFVAEIENNLRFPGQYYDAETGLHYNWNRYYDPETGRYIAADPIGLDGGMNLYAYVGGDPINGVDPLGLCSKDCPDCPGGKWDVDVGGNASLVIGLGGSRSRITFTCLSTGKKCRGVLDCAVLGPIVDISAGGSIDIDGDIVGTGRTISGYYCNASIENYHASSWIAVAGIVGTGGNNVNVTGGLSIGVGKQFCTAKLIICED